MSSFLLIILISTAVATLSSHRVADCSDNEFEPAFHHYTFDNLDQPESDATLNDFGGVRLWRTNKAEPLSLSDPYGQSRAAEIPISIGTNLQNNASSVEEIKKKFIHLYKRNPVNQFVVLVVLRHHNTDLSSSCHGTILSERLVLIPSLCLGNIVKYPIRAIQVMNVTLDYVNISPDNQLQMAFNPNPEPKFVHLSGASKLCISGESDKPNIRGHLSMLRLGKPLKAQSFKPVRRAKSVETAKLETDLKLSSLNTSIFYRWAPVKETKCPSRINDNTIACFEKDASIFGALDSPWFHNQGLCHSEYTDTNKLQQYPLTPKKVSTMLIFFISLAQQTLGLQLCTARRTIWCSTESWAGHVNSATIG